MKLNLEKSQAVDDFGPDSDEVAAIEESRLAADRKVLTRACYLLGSRPGECPDRQSPLAKRIRKALYSDSPKRKRHDARSCDPTKNPTKVSAISMHALQIKLGSAHALTRFRQRVRVAPNATEARTIC